MSDLTCPKCWGDGYIDHDLGREVCTCVDSSDAHRPNGCCDYHRHIADGCCHCESVTTHEQDAR